MKKIAIQQFIKDNQFLKQINEVDLDNRYIQTYEILVPGVELAGFFEYYHSHRVQLYGMQEINFIKNQQINEVTFKKLLIDSVPCIIFANNQMPDEQFRRIASENNIPILLSSNITSKTFSILYQYLEDKLAPEVSVHGVMVSVFGKGVLIKGPSGIGKSELALELIKERHFLIADDSVILRKIDSDTLISSAPKLLKNKMEIRGIGIVDIQKLYGVTSVIKEKELDLIVELTNEYDNVERIGTNKVEEEILGVYKQKITIPILSGKNLVNLVEVAVANFQLKNDYNYDSAEEFVNNLNEMLIQKNESKLK